MWKLAGLWRDADFMKLWSGQTVSRFGSSITATALGLTAVLLLRATPFDMGLLVSAGAAPTLLAGPLVGSLIDRVPARPLLILTDLLRALVLALVPLLALLGWLRLCHLLIVAALMGVLTLVFEVAQQSYVPTLVGDRLVEANGRLRVSDSLAEVIGNGLAGALVQALTGPIAILIDCVTYVVSAVLIGGIGASEPASLARNDGSGSLFAGWELLRRQPVLRAFAAHAVADSFFGSFIGALYTLFCLRDLGMAPTLVGLSIAVGGIGNLIGAGLVERVVVRRGIGKTLSTTLVVGAAATAVLPAAAGPVPIAFGMIALSQIVGDTARAVFEVGELSVRQAIAPREALGRVNGALYVLVAGVGPLGALVGGYLGGVVGTRETLVIAVVGLGLGKLPIVFSPIGEILAVQDAAEP